MKKSKSIILLFFVFNVFLISKMNSQNVNEFTGEFSYSVPLITVPSPYGPPVSISAGYSAGIGVNQGASELGLGWGINAGGVINRSISGIPDDWDGVTITDPQSYGFKTQGGLMYFNTDVNRRNMDFYSSSYKTDTQSFYFPNYDFYSINGPGISGSLNAHLFDFATTELNVLENAGAANEKVIPYTMDATYGGFQRTLRFNFNGDYGGNFKSRHYSTTPISSSTTLKIPGDLVTDTEYGLHRAPYVGVSNVGYDSITNRLASAKYVEYTSDANGITGFKLTDESGFVYNYSKAVYINSVTFGNYPLDNEYKVKNYISTDTTRVTGTGGNYYIKDNALSGNVSLETPYMVEWKQDAKYAYQWLLTSITGPDYVDVTSNGVTIDDKGYWVSYSWKQWADKFTKRTPEYGFNYSFAADENEKTQNEEVTSSTKISGKFGTFSKYEQEVYYLNSIQTSSHTAIFVRDVRLDDCSSEPYNYDNQSSRTFNMPAGTGTLSKTSNYGTLYDSGGPAANCSSSVASIVTISPGVTGININFNSFAMASGESVYILDSADNILDTYTLSSGPTLNTNKFYARGTIKVKEVTGTGTHLAGFRLSWSSAHSTVYPQLKLTRVVLFTNEDYNALPVISNLSTSISAFNITDAGIGRGLFYNETWYAANLSSIQSKSLQTVEFNQDNSLSRKYTGNVKTTVCATDKLSNSSDVVNGMYVHSVDYTSSGKLTLNEITTYGLAHVKTSPSVLFDYNKLITTDNPNYNPVKVDYSGFYKSDASAQGYSGYTTSASKDSTDAWSLRKISTPLGGTIEINYESNQYEKVFDGNGGFRGPSKMYGINSFYSPSSLGRWRFTLEENVSTPSDFTDLRTSPPSGTVRHIFIPFIETTENTKYIASDTFKFSSTDYINKIQNISIAGPPITSEYYVSCDTAAYLNLTNLKYTGNGYIHFDLPVGSAVYGGGVRVKSLVTKNGTTDSYTTEYTYSEGVTPMEIDRFGEEKKTVILPHYVKLRPVEYDKHRMGPNIGYTKVTVKNKGQNNIANGSEVSTFITSDQGIDNYKVIKQRRIALGNHPYGIGSCSSGYNDTSHIIEVVNKFSGYYGQLKETKVLDINDNIISRTVNEYANLTQGAIVENYNFFSRKKYGGVDGGCYEFKHNVCIERKFPVVLSKQTVYSKGISSVTEYLKFDEISMTPTEIRTTNPNKGIQIDRGLPAFRISQNAAMGPKSVTSTNANIISPSAYSRLLVDTTITASSDFESYTIQTYKKNYNIRMFSVGWNKFVDSAHTNKSWIADRSYSWVGDSSAIDDYGLFKQSSFVAFDYTLASINKKWQLGTENTLLDNSGHIIEVKGFNNRFSAIKYGYSDTLQIAEANNVNFSSFTYSGFESAVKDHDPGAGTVNYIDGEIKVNAGVKFTATVSVPAHTGTYLMKVPSGTTGSNSPTYSVKYISANPYGGLLKGRTYRASVWVHTSSPAACQLSASFAGGAAVSIAKSSALNVTIGDWILMNLDIAVSAAPADGDELKVYLESSSGDAFFDDIRVHPVDASISATVYEPKTFRVAATLDGNNFATIYKYDAAGRVTEVWQEIEGVGLKKMKKYQYNFSRGLN